MGSLPDIDSEIKEMERKLDELRDKRRHIVAITGTQENVKCKKCMDKGYIEKYFDAGDHFGGGSAPGSEWRRYQCDCTKQ
jgi:hypothetical protein